MSIYRIESMSLLSIYDLTHREARGDLILIWKQKYSLPAGGNCFVFCNSTFPIGIVVFNGVKRVVVDVALTL